MANPSVFVEFVANTQKLAAGVKDLQKTGDQASKGWDWKRVAKWAGAAAAVGAASKYVKDAVGQTEDLAKSTLALTRTTGMDVKTSSEWAEVLHSRGIETKAFQMGMVKLSKEMTNAAAGSKKSVAAFQDLGVSMEDVRAGNTQAVIMQVADGLSKMTNPAKRAALAQQLFARQGQALAPLLFKGSAAIQEQLDTAAKYGATLDGETTKSVGELIAQQREMGIAMDGVKIKVGTALMPVILDLSSALVDLLRIFQPLLTSATALKIVIGVLAGAFIAYKVAMIAATIAENVFNVTLGATQILLTAGIVVAIMAVIAAGYLLYKHWDDLSKLAGKVWDGIKKGAQAALSWIRSNWPLILGVLTGPFGLAIVAIYKNWDRITAAVRDAVNTMKNLLSGFLGWLGGIATSIAGVVSRIVAAFGRFDDPVRASVTAIKDALGSLPGFITGIIARVRAAANAVADAIRAPINAVIRAWNGISFTIPKIKLPSVKIAGHKIGGGSFGGWTVAFPNIPTLAAGGIVTTPTLAMIGEAGPEAVVPLSNAAPPIEVRVFIGETELRGLVKAEVRTANNRTAQVLLAGAR
jgi:hypothetical protein